MDQELGHKILDIILYIGMVILVVVIFLLGSVSRRQPLVFRWLIPTLVFSLSCDLISILIILDVFGGDPNIGGNLYTLGDVLSYSPFFYFAIGWKPLQKYFIAINIGYLIFVICNFMWWQKNAINSYSDSLFVILIVFFCLTYYYKLLRELPTEDLFHMPLFWIISAMFVGLSGKLVLYSIIEYLMGHMGDNLLILFIIHNSITIIQNLMYLWGAWLQYKIIKNYKPVMQLQNGS
ncbi:MAG TPA: hypothetical protein VD884_07075 [Ohtaekwangia sp.]|nr:hypothetical protein [Ohtaekwangia sp.]